MKKSLIALAVLAASGAAMAQSSVTLYGVLDIGFGKVKGQKWGMNNGEGYSTSPATYSADGFNSTSVIGFRGVEDLGGGLKANFNLQSGGLDLSSGSTSVAFSREAWVGLEGASWGAIQFGRSAGVAAKTMGVYDFNGTSYSSALDRAGVTGVTWYGTSRRSSQVQYLTPNFGGFTLRAGFTAKGDQEVGTPSVTGGATKAQYSLGATFANGPLSISAAGETKSKDGERTAYAVGASYNLTVVKLGATYNRRETTGVDGYNTIAANTGRGAGGNGWSVSAVAPLGAANIGVQYARNNGANISAVEVFANYALSKRTRLYADFVKTSGQDATAAVAATATAAAVPARPSNPYAFGVGVVHTF